ncbi:kinesin-associated protein 3 [Austrofundulus limnaeus]|uniref:Kinesin-associated protein 3 n=1 Tax=Austrofundulus limnaeus TaxID=52670 RepID=A0A2I4CWT5_AUSLI|nr:PREDICTED: kinesin-associated protein 3-like [Austrofundulus limnaeus]
MHDNNAVIRTVCNNTLDIIAENDEDWCRKIQSKTFCWYNSQWLGMVENRQLDGTTEPQQYEVDQDFLERPDLFSTADGIISADGTTGPDQFFPDFQNRDDGETKHLSSSELLPAP